MRSSPLLRLLLALPALAWSGCLLAQALHRWRFEAFCAMSCPTFVPAELAGHYRRAMDWQTPLLLAALPLALLAARWLLRRLAPLQRPRAV